MMDSQLQQLLGIWLNEDEASAADLDALRNRLKNDRGFLMEFVRELDMLGDLKTVQSPQPRWLKLQDEIGSHSETDDFDEKVVTHFDRFIAQRKRKSFNLPFWTLALFGSLLVGLLFYIKTDRKSPSNYPAEAAEDDGVSPIPEASREAVAVISRSLGAVWSSEHPADNEHTLAPGPVILDEGLVQLDFLGGAHIVIKGPTELDIQSAKKISLKHGHLSCRVSELGKGFQVSTAHRNVIDQGTAFAIISKPADRTEVHVTEGSLTIDNQFIEVGNAVAVSNKTITPVPFRNDQFIGIDEFHRRIQLVEKEKMLLWRESATELSADPDVLLHYTMEGQNQSGPEIINQAKTTHGGRATNAMILGTRWSSGRWPEKAAIHFFSEDDRLLTKLPGAYDELTFLIWAKVDALTQTLSAFLLTEEPQRWALNGSIPEFDLAAAAQRRGQSETQALRWIARNRSNTLDFNIAYPGNYQRQSIWDQYRGNKPVFDSSRWGLWSCYAVTYSRKSNRVTHYFNGEMTNQSPIKRPASILLDYMEIGNLSTSQIEEDAGVQYRFYGLMDEILVAKRAFSAAQIQTIYQNGNPES